MLMPQQYPQTIVNTSGTDSDIYKVTVHDNAIEVFYHLENETKVFEGLVGDDTLAGICRYHQFTFSYS